MSSVKGGTEAGGDTDSIRIAYADPPYIGEARALYGCEEIDHRELLQRLESDYPDGWALSCSTSPDSFWDLAVMVSELPKPRPRLSSWVKPFASFKPGVNPAYAWEPVIWKGGRKKRSRSEPTIRDWVSCNITLKKGLAGAKPPGFCVWLFQLLGMRPGDEFVDLFPGTGGVTAAWLEWSRRMVQQPLIVGG